MQKATHPRNSLQGRARFLGGVFILIALTLVVRLYFVQIVHGEQYQESAMGQYVQPSPGNEDRGTIFFTTKDGSLVAAAVSESGYEIAINPQTLANPQTAYQKLNAIAPIDQKTFLNAVAKKNATYLPVAQHLDASVGPKVQALQIPGVILSSDEWRQYPGGDLAAQALGFVGFEGTSTIPTGEYGLERSFNTTLLSPSAGLYVNPFAEIFTNVQEAVASDPTNGHGSIITSIEPNVQAQLEKTLESVMQQYAPQFAGGIVMDPHTGEIYAIAGNPSFDPNNFGSVDDPIQYQDREVQGRYEMGSIMKPLTMAAGIDSGAVTKNTTYDDTGCITVSTFKVCNYDFKARGVIPMQQILSQSLNVGASWVATQTGYPTFTKYMKAYGFNQKTGVDLPGEVAGDLGNLDDGSGPAVNFDTASFGQGITVTPIEMIRALSVLANAGQLPNPHVVTGIQYESGVTRQIPITEGPQVIKASSAATVTDMLTTVFDDALGNGKFKQVHYSFAAKTGTAQIPMPGGGYYPGDTYLHSFFGYFPAHNPRFIIFLFAWKPHGQEYASATLAQPFMNVAQFLINYYNIPPDR
jgi:cell division protein FtsI/penicillin-binding protein 2